MKRKMLFLVFTIIVNINLFGQTLSTGATISVCAGGSVSVTALPGASGANNYSWSGGLDPVVAAGAPSSTATIVVTPVSSPYSLTCYFFNGTTYITSQTVVVTVNPIPTVTGIESLSQCADGSFTLVSSTTPQDMSFQWQISSDGIVWNNQSGATENNLVLTDLSTQNGKQYRSIASYSSGCRDTTGVKALTVNPLPLNQIPTINGIDVFVHTVLDRGECEPVPVIGLKTSELTVTYELQMFYSPNTVLDTVVGTGSAIQFTPQEGVRCRIVAVSAGGCRTEITK